MRLKPFAVVLICLFGATRVLSGDIDDELLWEKLVKGLRNDSVDMKLGSLEETEHWDILETDLNTLSENGEMPLSSEKDVTTDIASSSESFRLDLSHGLKTSPIDVSSDRISRHPLDSYTSPNPDTSGTAGVGIKGATSKPKPGQTSLVIIFDATGSMLDDLIQLRKGAKEIVAEVTNRENNPIYNYIFIPFRDPDYGPVVNTVDQNELLQAMEDVELRGGGECPEAPIKATNAGLDMALPKSFVYIFTDATAEDYKLADETTKMIQEKQITLTFLLTGFCNAKQSEGYYVYETLAAISNGQVYNLQKTHIKDVLESIKQYLDANLIPISYVFSENPGSQDIELDVSKNLKEFTVSLAGDKPNITVTDPNQEEYKQQKDVLELESLKIVNVQDPAPGKWNVHTEAESEHSVKLTAVSDVAFKFGFSTSLPGSISETDMNPTKNVNNFLVVSTSNNSLLHNLTTAEVILFNAKEDPDEKRHLQINLPLTKPNPSECDDDSCLYVTKPFPPPLSLFKIYVNGFDSDGNPLRSLLSTAIQARNGEIPRIYINESFLEVTEGDPAEVYCKVVSATPSAVHWIVNDGFRDAIRTSEKGVWKYSIESTKLSDAGTYVCDARNVHGKDKGQINLIVKEKIIPLQIRMVDTNMVSTENDTDYQISCYIRPRQKAVIEWFFNGKKINPIDHVDLMTQNVNLVLTQVRRNHSGDYTCVANNQKEIKNATGHLTVFYEPQMLNPKREERIIPFGDFVTLDCNAIGSPIPLIVWHRENLSEVVSSTIDKFTPNHQGLYLCEASNGIGKAAWKEIHLEGTARDPPSIIPPPFGKLEKKLGDDLQLKCECFQCGPVYYFKWYRVDSPDGRENEQTIIGIGPERNAYTQSFKYNLELKNLNASNDGYYVCEIGNEHGIDKIITRVSVLGKPTIEELDATSDIFENMIKIHKGLDLRVECLAGGSPTPDIHWQKDSIGIIPTKNMYTTMNTLVIRNVSESDMGEYRCVASNSLGMASKEVLLYVVVPPTFLAPKDTIITAEEGQIVRIMCDVFAIPFPTIRWSFNNEVLNLTDKRYELFGSELSFEAEYKDNGIYNCEATNEVGKASSEVVLIVYVPPTVYPVEDDAISVRTNKNTTLKCKVEGYPVPDLLWTFDGEELTNSSNAYLLSGGDLLLVNVSIAMAGPYICEATNKVGQVQRTSFVTVTEPPKILSQFDSVVNVTTDTSFSLICAAKGTPRPDIFWAKNGEKYTDGHQQQFLDVSFGKISSGKYTCIAQSPEGADTKTVIISAIEPPRLDDIQSILRRKINVTEGDTLEVKCPFINTKKVTWYKDDYRYHNDPVSKSSTSLLLPGAALSDRGNYTCVAENEAGSVNFTQQVIVLAPPRVVTNDIIEKFGDLSRIPEITVQAGEDLDINCPMEGFPQPKVKWMKDSTVISTEVELILTNVQPYHEGRYDCEARNSLGSADYSYIVKVLAPPTTHLPKHTWKEIHEGENLDLECSFLGSPSPKLAWERNNMSLTEENGSTLQLKNVQPKDKGVYKCSGRNIAGVDEIFYTVDILETPKLTFINDNVRISETQELMLRCAARGNPLPIVAWTYNGQMIIGTSKIPRTFEKSYGLLELDESGSPFSSIQSNDVALSNVSGNVALESIRKGNLYGKVYYDRDSVSLMLIIRSPNRKLPGKYTCHAVNALGSEQMEVDAEILAAPRLEGRDLDTQPLSNLTLLGGLPIILYCPWYGKPLPNVDWYKDNVQIENSHKEQISHDRRTLTISVSDASDSGIYHCRAKNNAGFGQKQFNVNILAPPHFRLGNIAGNFIDDSPERATEEYARQVVPGEKIIFNCPVSGNPLPSVFWLETTVGDVNDTRILPETTNQLILSDIEKSATYTCYANNTLGSTEKQYEVLVLKTPEMHSYEPQQTVYEHRTITLNCPVVGGSPKPEITWLKDGHEIHENSKSIFFSQDKTVLKILNAKKEDSGVYKCRAVNIAGQREQDINVTVTASVVWSNWDPWAPCSQSCGLGTSTRKRRCTRLNGEAINPSDPPCTGRSYESKTCELSPCPIDGGWGPWSNWTSCSKSCWDPRDQSKPTRKRYRECDSPKPAMGGRSCSGSDYEEVACNIMSCVVKGGWSSWTVWSPCSVSCGNGFSTRYRECNNPIPLNGGQMCIGSALESQICFAGPCPIHGGWTDWSSWSECSQTCGTGYRKRKRTCSNPEPRYGGLHCLGDNVEVLKCRIRKCDNSDLLRNLDDKPFIPAAEYVSKVIYNPKDALDYVPLELDDSSIDYATGSNSFSTPMDDYEPLKTTSYDDENKGTHVVVKVEKLTPIDKDTAQINFHPGLDPIVVKQVLPCNIGFKLTADGTCADIDECALSNPCGNHQFCSNIAGGYTCSCVSGYKYNAQMKSCEDIDECLDRTISTCSHECKNTPGSFICSCPHGQILSLDLRNCIKLATTTNDYQMSDPAAKSFDEDCHDGYYFSDGSCRDINECQDAEDDCGMDQTCLNTNGSYLCIPTPCPAEYTRDAISRQCVLMCDPLKPCPEGAKISQTISYTLLTRDTLTQSEPFLKMVNYDVNRVPLPETKFTFENGTNPTLFRLVTMPFRKGIAYLYGSNKIKKEKLYNVKVKAYSNDSKNEDLLYVTRFIIYLYVV